MHLEMKVAKRLPGFSLGLDLACEAGTLVLFGPSGSGKSLSLQCLAGIFRPDQGRIVLNGQVLYDSEKGVAIAPQNRQIGYVPQSYALFPHLSVAENIAFGIRRQDRSLVRSVVGDLMDMLRLTNLEQRRPRELSGGQQQRVALARALAIRPRVLLLDEPFSALDAAIRRVLTEDLMRVRRELGVGIVLITHGIVDTYALADAVAIYQNGQVMQVGPPDEVFRHPISVDIARLTGVRNVLAGMVVAANSGGSVVEVHGVRLKTHGVGLCVGEPVLVTIRPEEAHLVGEGDSVTEDESVVPCVIRSVASQGHLYAVEVSLNATLDPLVHVLVPVWWWQRHRLDIGAECQLAVAKASVNALNTKSDVFSAESGVTAP